MTMRTFEERKAAYDAQTDYNEAIFSLANRSGMKMSEVYEKVKEYKCSARKVDTMYLYLQRWPTKIEDEIVFNLPSLPLDIQIDLLPQPDFDVFDYLLKEKFRHW